MTSTGDCLAKEDLKKRPQWRTVGLAAVVGVIAGVLR